LDAVIEPLHLSTSFAQVFPGVRPGKDDPNSYGAGFFYSRFANPTRGLLERTLASIEKAKHAVAYSSGMAAIAGAIALVPAGSNILALDDLYGGTSAYFRDIVSGQSDLRFTFTDMSDVNKLEAQIIATNAKLIFIER